MAGYTVQTDQETTARAIGKELSVSPKNSMEICREIRGMDVLKAREYLEEVISLKKAVPFRRHCKSVAHKKGIRPCRYPQKAAKAILKVIENAQENAEYKGLDSENMKLMAISAHRGRVTKGFRPRAMGRSTPFNEQTTNIEVILEVLEE